MLIQIIIFLSHTGIREGKGYIFQLGHLKGNADDKEKINNSYQSVFLVM